MDCLVVGAGPAGLTAAIYLARFRRRFRVIDGGHSRARWIPVSHNHPGFPRGVPRPDLLCRMREQALEYGASIAPGEVARLERQGADGFVATVDGRCIEARRVLLATGCEDVEPDLPGVADAVRRGLVRYCPVCDAYEITDRKVALIGYGKCRMREALLLRAYTADLTVLTLGRPLDLAAEDARTLRDAGVRILDEPVARIAMEGGRLATWHTRGGVQHRFDALYTALGVRMSSTLARDLGAAMDEDDALVVDGHQRTSIPGLFAAGDVVQGLSQIGVAVGQAEVAANTINRSLPFPLR